MIIALFHGSHQQIFEMVSFDREGTVLMYSKFHHSYHHLHFQDLYLYTSLFLCTFYNVNCDCLSKNQPSLHHKLKCFFLFSL